MMHPYTYGKALADIYMIASSIHEDGRYMVERACTDADHPSTIDDDGEVSVAEYQNAWDTCLIAATHLYIHLEERRERQEDADKAAELRLSLRAKEAEMARR